MRLLAPLVVFCLLAVGAPSSLELWRASAEPLQTHTLTGKVIDPAVQPIAGALVELRQGEAVLRRTTSDAQGDWRFEKVAPVTTGCA